MAISIDTSGIGVGLGLLADAIVRKKQRERLGQFQASTSILARLQDPTLDIEARNSLKQELAKTLRMPDASSIPDDMSELTGKFDTILRENFPEIASSPLQGKKLDDIMSEARANEKMNEISASLETMFANSPSEVRDVFMMLRDHDPEMANKFGLQIVASKAQAFSNAETQLSLRQSDIGEAAFQQQMDDNWKMFNDVLFPQYKQKAAFQASLYPKKGSGGKSFTFKDAFAIYDKTGKNAADLIENAKAGLRDRRSDRDKAIKQAEDAGVEIGGLAQSRFIDGHEGRQPLSELDMLGLITAYGGDSERLYSDLKTDYPNLSRKDLNEMVNTYQNASPAQRAAISDYFEADNEYKFANEDLKAANLLAQRAAEGMAGLYKMSQQTDDVEAQMLGDIAGINAARYKGLADVSGEVQGSTKPTPPLSVEGVEEEPGRGELIFRNLMDDANTTGQKVGEGVENLLKKDIPARIWFSLKGAYNILPVVRVNDALNMMPKAAGQAFGLNPGDRDKNEDRQFKEALEAAKAVPEQMGTPKQFIYGFPTMDAFIDAIRSSTGSNKPLYPSEVKTLEEIWTEQRKLANIPAEGD